MPSISSGLIPGEGGHGPRVGPFAHNAEVTAYSTACPSSGGTRCVGSRASRLVTSSIACAIATTSSASKWTATASGSSVIAPVRLTATGRPDAAASNAGRPYPSSSDGADQCPARREEQIELVLGARAANLCCSDSGVANPQTKPLDFAVPSADEEKSPVLGGEA